MGHETIAQEIHRLKQEIVWHQKQEPQNYSELAKLLRQLDVATLRVQLGQE